MKKALISIAVGSSFALGELLAGQCPEEYEYTKKADVFDKNKVTGLWYEYVWEPSYNDGFPYDCGMWTILKDSENDTMMTYSHVTTLLPEAERTKDSTTGNKHFGGFDLNWVAPTPEGHQQPKFSYNRRDAMLDLGEDEADKKSADKHMHILYTNYYSYLVGKSCQNVSADQYEEAWFVWTREKKPAFYWRREVRDYLVNQQGFDVSQMHKGQLFECWGKDK